MTCACPPGWCYLRPDCRHPHRRQRKAFLARAQRIEAAARENMNAIGDQWLYERREDLQADLAGDHFSEATRRAKTDALERVEAIIERKERGQV